MFWLRSSQYVVNGHSTASVFVILKGARFIFAFPENVIEKCCFLQKMFWNILKFYFINFLYEPWLCDALNSNIVVALLGVALIIIIFLALSGVPLQADLGLAHHDHGLDRGPAALRIGPERHDRPVASRPPNECSLRSLAAPGASRRSPGRCRWRRRDVSRRTATASDGGDRSEGDPERARTHTTGDR